MKKTIDIIGLPVISITEGKEIGLTSNIVVDASNGTIAALTIDDGKWYMGAKLLPYAGIAGIGESAVTVNSTTNILPIASAPELEKLLEANVKVIGTKVLTKTGHIQGKVTELMIDDQGRIIDFEIEEASGQKSTISATRVCTFGKDVIIIASADETPQKAPITEAVKTENMSIEYAAPEVSIESPAAPNASNHTEDSSKKSEDKSRKYLLGKKATRRIQTDNGVLIVENGGEITEEVLQKAKLSGKFVELSMNAQ